MLFQLNRIQHNTIANIIIYRKKAVAGEDS